MEIGSITARSGGWVPAFELRDVVLRDAAGQPALVLPRLAAALSPRTLTALEPRFRQVLVEGAQLEVRRDAQGRFVVGGLVLGGPGPAKDDGAADWFFRQGEFVIRGGSLRWTDEQRGAPPLALADVQIVIRNGLRRHDLRLDATPPAAWGQRFRLDGRFTQPLLARPGDWRQWTGTLHADLPRADVRELRQYLALPVEVTEGDGALRAWVDVAGGEARGGTVDLALRAVRLKLGPDVEPLVLAQIHGRLEGQRDDKGFTAAARRFGFVTDDGVRWPEGDAKLAWRQPTGKPVAGGSFEADRIDLALVSQIAARIPISQAVRRHLAELAPRGVVSDLSTRWDGSLDAPDRFQAKGTMDGLAIAAQPPVAPDTLGQPGLDGARVVFQATERGGEATLSMTNGHLDLPGALAEPRIPLDRAEAQFQWSVDRKGKGPDAAPADITLQIKQATVSNADLQGQVAGTWRSGSRPDVKGGAVDRYPGRLDLSGQLTRGTAARVARYLPLEIGADARDYVTHAVRGGRVASASFHVRGDLRDFPFHRLRDPKDGEFRVVGRLEDVELDYVPGSTPAWPAFHKLGADLVIDRGSLDIRNAQAETTNLALSKVQVGIHDLIDKPVLQVDGQVGGTLADMLRFVEASPVGEMTGHAFAKSQVTGPGALHLGLTIPLQAVKDTQVRGSLTLTGNDVRIVPDAPAMDAATARVDFSEKGVTAASGQARALGGEMNFDGATAPDGAHRFHARGTASADGLRRAPELGFASQLADSLSGQAAYQATIAIVRGQVEVGVQSDLVGMASKLPAPLAKAAEAPLPLKLQTALVDDARAEPPRDTFSVDVGELLHVRYLRELAADTTRVISGGIGVQAAAPQPDSGVAARVEVASFDADAWTAVSDRWTSASAAPASGAETGDDDSPYAPTSVTLHAKELLTHGRKLDRVLVGASREGRLWRANIDAAQLDGYAEYRVPRRGAGRVYARLSRLSLPKSDADDVDNLLDQRESNVPALDIVVDDFELRGKRLGKVEIEAVNRSLGPVREGREREWQLTRLAVTLPEAKLTASGNWVTAIPGKTGDAGKRATLDFNFDISDSGALLERLGSGGTLKGGKGQLTGQVSWLGSPLSLDYASMDGQVKLAMQSGQFLKTEPGAARLLSVLSLQSIPRRLALDFRDVFEQGFAFDSVTGDVRIAKGTAYANNLRMRGLQAAVLMEGSADLAHETQDLRVVVVPEINAGTASLAYAVINPAIGLGTFLAQFVLRKPLIQASTREFKVTGTWAEPKVDKVERSLTAPVPDINEPLPVTVPASAAGK